MTEITLNQKELEQVQKFFALLDGKENRNPISFALIAKCLDLDPVKLNNLYSRTLPQKEAPIAPPGFKWKLVREIDEQ